MTKGVKKSPEWAVDLKLEKMLMVDSVGVKAFLASRRGGEKMVYFEGALAEVADEKTTKLPADQWQDLHDVITQIYRASRDGLVYLLQERVSHRHFKYWMVKAS
tara:strand:+ start:299 stop:610 length:312 start_codon:yes stop_codon:yes gene_type:complete